MSDAKSQNVKICIYMLKTGCLLSIYIVTINESGLNSGPSIARIGDTELLRDTLGKVTMSTNKINPASINANQQLNKFKKVDSEKSDKAGNDVSVKSGIDQSKIASEKLDISQKAHNLQKLKEIMEAGRAALAEEPPVREDKVAEVRQKLADGFYKSADVKAEVAAELSVLMSRMDKLLK